MRHKVSVIGMGNVGATVAQRIFDTGYADLAVVDAKQGVAEGKALDILESGPALNIDSQIVGATLDYKVTANSDLVVITAGITRSPGMSRDDLLATNVKVLSSVTEQVVKHSPNCVIVVVTNPLDAMVQLVYELSGFPKNRVVGMAGILDTSRFRTFLAQELGVAVQDVNAYVLGGHGDQMVPLKATTNIGGQPVQDLIPADRLEQIVQRARDGGAEVVNLLGTSAYYAPSASVVNMVDAILLDRKQILPCATLLEGEYGVNGYFVGVPVKFGAAGVERIIELPLSTEEQEAFNNSAATVKNLVAKVRELIKN